MGENPSHFDECGDDCPVERVSWFDVVAFCNALSRAEGLEECYVIEGEDVTWPRGLDCTGYRLPTEAEWEYACRAGTTTAYSWGNSIAASNANYTSSGINQTRDVGQYAANPWGFFDMHGNVWEWVADRYNATYPTGSVTDPTGPASGSTRVLRGGSWYTAGTNLRSAGRSTR
ncbi:MAG: formylglycine-generating enzyme family protein, partial [Lentisphaeria bacterium]|nr:formylglycine-generating enzyme family protein [Lentisphaeria bacterium]